MIRDKEKINQYSKIQFHNYFILFMGIMLLLNITSCSLFEKNKMKLENKSESMTQTQHLLKIESIKKKYNSFELYIL